MSGFRQIATDVLSELECMVGACDGGLQIAQDSIDASKALYACALAVLANDFLLTDT